MILRDAHRILGEVDALDAENWASMALGQAWEAAGISEREPERTLCLKVARRASSHPSPEGLAAVAALRRICPETERSMLDETIEALLRSQPRPRWIDTPAAVPLAAWRSVDVWESNRVLWVEYTDPRPHTLMASVMEVTGLTVDTLRILKPGAAERWEHEDRKIPMPISERPVDEVLAELAHALRRTDMTIPREDDEDFVALRSLAWSRCRAHLPEWPEWSALPDDERKRLVDAFVADCALPDTDVTRSLADLFLDYGDGYINAGPLAWSPDRVGLFLADWLPRKAILDADQRTDLPEALRRWVSFALRRRGVEAQWIGPVVEAVDEYVPVFAEAFDDETAWGPAKAIAAELVGRGIDLSDRAAVDDEIRSLNAERLALRLRDER